MRLWSIHPKYLDAKGLVALWREGLLAQKALLGETRGYRNHPQLLRFKDSKNPLGAIARYLRGVNEEALKRRYRFDSSKIINRRIHAKLAVSKGQVEYEFSHLLAKLALRDESLYLDLLGTKKIALHALFRQVPGDIADWEIVD